MMLDQCRSLDDFLLHYGGQLAAEARNALDPMHVPGRDAVSLPPLLRTPFPAQGHVMTAATKLLASSKSVQVIAEMGCIDGDAVVQVNRGGKGFKITLAELHHKFHGGKSPKRRRGGSRRWDSSTLTTIRSLCGNRIALNRIVNVVDSGVRKVVKLTLASGKTLRLTPDHEVATPSGVWTPAEMLKPGDKVLTNGKWVDKDGYVRVGGLKNKHPRWTTGGVYEHILVAEKMLGRHLADGEEVHHKNRIRHDNRPENLEVMSGHAAHMKAHEEQLTINLPGMAPLEDTVVSVVPDGEAHTYDVVCADPYRSFVANGIVVHNSGKTLMAEGIVHADCLRRYENAWNELNGRPREIRLGLAPDRNKDLARICSEVVEVGPVKWLQMDASASFVHCGRKWTKVGRDVKGVPGKGPVYDAVVLARPAGVSRGKPVGFRTVCKGAYRVLGVAPTTLVEKWKRELIDTVPHAVVYMVEDYRQLLALARRWAKARGRFGKLASMNEGLEGSDRLTRDAVREWPIGYEYYMIGRDRMKLSCGWEPAYTNRTWSGGKMVGQHSKDGLPACPRCGSFVYKRGSEDPVDEGYFRKPGGQKTSRRVCSDESCGEQLWQETAKPRRYAPSRVIQKRLKKFFDVTVFDEAHEYKSGDSMQADAIGGIASASKRCVALTGTLVGGYAWHVRTLLYRLGIAGTMVEEGLGWKQEQEFNAKYGRLVTKETICPDDGDVEVQGYASGRGGKKKKSSKHVKPEPGIMPTLFRHLVGNSIFLSLGEVADNLPRLDERVFSVEMDPELSGAYQDVDDAIRNAIRDMVRKGNKKALGMMLNVLMCYPDYAWEWGDVGYYDVNMATGEKEWRFVCRPANLDPGPMREKERVFCEWAKGQVLKGHQVWGYCVYTEKRDCLSRLQRFLQQDGLRVKIMRAEVEPAKREAWIDEHGPKHDVILSHPQLVQTGLDFFSKKTGHNYSSIGFYQTGYSLFTLRQASRRAWRIGQRRPCETAYFYYDPTMQSRAMGLMGKKLQAAQALEGNFSAEGLAAMAGDEGSVEMALAKSLVDRVDETVGSRAWQKVTDAGKEREPETEFDLDAALAGIAAEMEALGISAEELGV